MKTYKLNATTQKSYYGKAVVIEDGSEQLLKSYNTIVCKIDQDGNFIKLWNGYSKTTMSHINDFRRLNNLASLGKREWDKLPCSNTKRFKVEMSNGFYAWTLATTFDNEEDAYNYADTLIDRSGYRLGCNRVFEV